MKVSYDNFIQTMSMLSVPLTPKLERGIQELIDDGVAVNKADAARKALEFFIERHAIETVLKASREPTLEGDFDDLLKKF